MMNSSRNEKKLSFRLESLRNKFHQEKHIWDIGCDHGHLGLSFKDTHGVDEIHLVDPSEEVILRLREKLKDAYISKALLNIHHSNGQSIRPSSNNNCFFIAGMGGNEMGDIIQHILPKLDSQNRFVISPHRKILELRKFLNSLPLALLHEEVIFDEGHFYQVLVLIPNKEGRRVSLYGEMLWESECGQRYREQQIRQFSIHQDVASKEYVKYLTGL